MIPILTFPEILRDSYGHRIHCGGFEGLHMAVDPGAGVHILSQNDASKTAPEIPVFRPLLSLTPLYASKEAEPSEVLKKAKPPWNSRTVRTQFFRETKGWWGLTKKSLPDGMSLIIDTIEKGEPILPCESSKKIPNWMRNLQSMQKTKELCDDPPGLDNCLAVTPLARDGLFLAHSLGSARRVLRVTLVEVGKNYEDNLPILVPKWSCDLDFGEEILEVQLQTHDREIGVRLFVRGSSGSLESCLFTDPSLPIKSEKDFPIFHRVCENCSKFSASPYVFGEVALLKSNSDIELINLSDTLTLIAGVHQENTLDIAWSDHPRKVLVLISQTCYVLDFRKCQNSDAPLTPQFSVPPPQDDPSDLAPEPPDGPLILRTKPQAGIPFVAPILGQHELFLFSPKLPDRPVISWSHMIIDKSQPILMVADQSTDRGFILINCRRTNEIICVTWYRHSESSSPIGYCFYCSPESPFLIGCPEVTCLRLQTHGLVTFDRDLMNRLKAPIRGMNCANINSTTVIFLLNDIGDVFYEIRHWVPSKEFKPSPVISWQINRWKTWVKSFAETEYYEGSISGSPNYEVPPQANEQADHLDTSVWGKYLEGTGYLSAEDYFNSTREGDMIGDNVPRMPETEVPIMDLMLEAWNYEESYLFRMDT